MKDSECVRFLQWLLPQMQMRWPGFRKVRRQVCKRIARRMAELQLSDISAYRDWITVHPLELSKLDNLCRITISRFYRDRGVFDFLRDEVLPELAAGALAAGRGEVRCWSAGCASGEEPYTINIIWKQAVSLRAPAVGLTIVATDSNPQMLKRAQRGCYSRSSLKDFPCGWLTDCFSTADDEYCVGAEYRCGIDWLQQDIRHQTPEGTFDIIFCRHVAFTYFDEPLQMRVLGRLLTKLRPGGFLVTGKQESLPGTTPELTERGEGLGVYMRKRLGDSEPPAIDTSP